MSRVIWRPDRIGIARDAWENHIEDVLGPAVSEAVREEAPHLTGILQASTTRTVVGTGGGNGMPILRVESLANYSGIVHAGRPEVRPVNAKVLHWFDRVTGKDVFAMRSGPVRPNPYIVRALRKLGLRVTVQ